MKNIRLDKIDQFCQQTPHVKGAVRSIVKQPGVMTVIRPKTFMVHSLDCLFFSPKPLTSVAELRHSLGEEFSTMGSGRNVWEGTEVSSDTFPGYHLRPLMVAQRSIERAILYQQDRPLCF